MTDRRSWAEPYKIKMVEPIKMTTRAHREAANLAAGYNTFLLASDDVYIDLLTDSGTTAMSEHQWAGLMLGDEAYAGSRSFYNLVDAVSDVYGYEELVPTHQGRGAEHILSQILISDGDVVPGNMYFTTTKFHQEQAHDPASDFPFKGNVDLDKLKAVVDEHGVDRIPYISVETNVNMAGGQPVSMANLKATYEYCHKHDILVMLDATRAVENAYFIQLREEGYGERSIAEILREICSYTDGATMSSKKDNLVNIGGFLALRDPELARQARALLVAFEGLHTYGGMAGRDMEALARGMREMVATDDHIRARIGQVQYLGRLINEAGIATVQPIGGHAVFIDAAATLQDMPQDHFPAQALTAAIYVDSGVRAMERGVVSAGRNPQTGDHNYPKLELVRLTIPRRVYTQAHMDVVAESVAAVYENRDQIKGLKFTYEPDSLRFFQARFEEI